MITVKDETKLCCNPISLRYLQVNHEDVREGVWLCNGNYYCHDCKHILVLRFRYSEHDFKYL